MKPLYIKTLAVAGFLSIACTTKVSEWVLLNTVPNQYTLVYFHNTPVPLKVRQQNATLTENISAANIQFKDVQRGDADKPYYALYYGDRHFSSYADPGELRSLISSPLRDSVANELKAGKLCVMVFLKSDIKDKDTRYMSEVIKAVSDSPFGEIIPVIEISRKNIAEHHFISMLLNVEDDLKGINEPMIFGVFGRFKALEPLVAGGITEENINLMIDYLTADCSCLIKDKLPGTDILYTDEWDSPAAALVNAIIESNPIISNEAGQPQE
jgi:hypothetical protein